MGATVQFCTRQEPIQLFDKVTGSNLIWYDRKSADANAPVCKSCALAEAAVKSIPADHLML